MYDLEIIIPAELNEPFILQRFRDFKIKGLKNTDGYKIKIYFMVSHDNKPELIEELKKGWPDNFDIEAVVTPHKHVACRIMHYYTNYLKPNTARWYIQMDEDSMTNVDLLVKKLDENYCHEGLYQITGSLNTHTSYIERKILENMGFASWYHGEHPNHAYEIYITSQAAISKIYESKVCMQYFKIREEFGVDYGDHAMGHAARMVKIYTLTANFISQYPQFINYYTNQTIAHIHEVSRDRSPEIYNWLDLVEGQEDKRLDEEIIFDKNYFFSWGNEDKTWIYFKEDKKILNFNNELFGVWGVTPENETSIFMTNEIYKNQSLFILTKTKEGFKTKNNQIEIKNFF